MLTLNSRLTRRSLLATLGAISRAQPVSPPNILLIVADDLGYGDLGCYGQTRFATPEIDRLATQGMLLTNAYAGAAVCAPSRCCLMTGKHTGHATIRDNFGIRGRVPLRDQDVTVAEVLRQAGYRTGLIGKWGLGEAGTSGTPNDQGFDEFFGFLNQDHALEYYPTHLWDNRTEWFPPGNQGIKRKQYVQDLFTDRALRFIRESAQSPFFLCAAYTIPHASSEIGRDTGDGFVVPDYGPYGDRDWPRPEKGFAAMMHRLDRDVGRLVHEIDRLHLTERTLVLFTSDNGPALDGGHSPAFFNSSGGLRGKKGDLYEGGIRVPLIARWPGHVPAGSTSQSVCCFWDFLPSAAALAGVPAPPGLDGHSIVPALQGKDSSRSGYLYWEAPGKKGLAQAVRFGKWKAIRRQRLELYDLERDPGEQRDIAASEPSIVSRMKAIFQEARTQSADYPASL
jgi:arylsulfatase A-like enzyme